MNIDEIYEMRERIVKVDADIEAAEDKEDWAALDIAAERRRRLYRRYNAAIQTYLDETDGPDPK